MFNINLCGSILGMVGSYTTMAFTDFQTNQILEGGAALAFIGFLIYAVKTLWKEVVEQREEMKNQRNQIEVINREVRNSLSTQLEKSHSCNKDLNETLGKLADELTTRRKQRDESSSVNSNKL